MNRRVEVTRSEWPPGNECEIGVTSRTETLFSDHFTQGTAVLRQLEERDGKQLIA